jgi:hypothetical protein
MSQRSSGSPEPGNHDWPDDLWPDDDDRHGTAGAPGRRLRPAILAVIALVAALAGAGIALAVRDVSAPSHNAAAARSQQPVRVPGQSGLPGTGTNGPAGIFLIGQVTAVSRTAITIGEPGRSITAAVTEATRVTGKVSSISGIRVGDRVSAQITLRGGSYTTTAIQYPPRSPFGVTAP